MDTFKIQTHFGRMKQLEEYFNERRYEEIYVMTNLYIWSEIYCDPGIPIHQFIPIFLNEWETYWDNEYRKKQDRDGFEDHLDKMKRKLFKNARYFY